MTSPAYASISPDLSADYISALDAALASRLRIERHATTGLHTVLGPLVTIPGDHPEAEYALRLFASGNQLRLRESVSIYDTHTIRVLHAELASGAGVAAVQFHAERIDEPKRVVDPTDEAAREVRS